MSILFNTHVVVLPAWHTNLYLWWRNCCWSWCKRLSWNAWHLCLFLI